MIAETVPAAGGQTEQPPAQPPARAGARAPAQPRGSAAGAGQARARARRRNARGQGVRLADDIVAGALALIERTGSDEAVTLRAVAREIGIAAPSIYAHFADREAIIMAVVVRVFDELSEAITKGQAAAGPDPVDRLVAGPFWLRNKYPGITFSFVPGFDDVDPGGAAIGNLADPVRFGNSNICSFSPVGKASPGSVYLSNRKRRQAAVRVTPANAKIQIFTWHGKIPKWIKRW